MTNEEQLITFLLDKLPNSKSNIVSISKNSLEEIKMSEHDVIQTIYVLQEDGLINIKDKSIHDDLSRFWNVALKSSCIHYFENKKSNQVIKLIDLVKFLIPVLISIAALIVSILK